MKPTQCWTKSSLLFSLALFLSLGLFVLSGCKSKDETNGPTSYTEWPFDADEAQRRQEETAGTLDVAVECENEIGMKFRLIPAGEFMMGSLVNEEDRNDDEGPVHRVRLTRPYYMSAHEVTQEQWEDVMGTTLADLQDSDWVYVGQEPRCPVYYVSWYDAIAFCNMLSELEGRSPYYAITNIVRETYGTKPGIESAEVSVLGGSGYRLPSEAEWEYACRAGSEEASYGELDEIAWYLNNSDGKTHPVGGKLPNSFGLFDIMGNVREWCEDWYDVDYYADSPMIDPMSSNSGKGRVDRGGSWSSSPEHFRAADRSWYVPDARRNHLGFRIVCSVE